MTGSGESRPAVISRRRYLVVDQGVMAVVITVLINIPIALLLVGSRTTMPFAGENGIAADVHGTCIVLPLVSNLIVTMITRSLLLAGKLEPRPLRSRGACSAVLHHLIGRGVTLAAATWLALAFPTIWSLEQLGVTELGRWEFVAFKSLYAGALAGVICPPAAWLCLGDEVTIRPK